MVNVNEDNDAATTSNGSTARLDLPAGATVLFAGLYWGADRSAGTNGSAADASTAAGRADFKVPGGTYATLTATTTDFGTGQNTSRYQSFVDVTARVQAAGAGTYAVGDVAAGTGQDRYAGWSLIVAYRDPAQPARNLTIFDGFKTIASGAAPTTIPVSGFQTPPAEPVRTTLGFVAYEGDLGLGGDTAALNTTTLNNAANGATNFFNSSISAGGAQIATRAPSYTNTLGYDADLFNADGVLANGATDATIRLTTNSDQYLPGVITFATELFAPAITLEKSVANLTHPGGPAQRGDVLRYTVLASNTGQDGADDFVLTDAIPSGTTYVAGTLRITTGAPASPTDASGDDRGEYLGAARQVRFRLGTGATATLGGRLAAGGSSTVTFDVRIGDVDPRTEITNAADSTFVSQSLRVPLTGRSNEVTTVVAAPDLTLAKIHSPAFVLGARTVFRLIASNVGNLRSDGSAVTVTDSFDGAAFASISNAGGDGWTCTTNGLDLSCTRSDVLEAGASYPPILVDAIVRDPAPLAISNTARVAGGGDVVPGNNTATDVGAAGPQADLSITKTVDPASATSGTRVTYTLVVLNRGPSVAGAVRVDDPVPAGLTDVVATAPRGTCNATVACVLGSLAPGESATVTAEATVTANNTAVTNTATVSSPIPDPDTSNNSADASLAVPNSADLRVTKLASNPNPAAGSALTYTITVSNGGPGAASDVVAQDDAPADFVIGAVAAPVGFTCAPPAGQTIVCTGATLAAGATATVVVAGTVAANPGPLMRNTARVRATTPDPDPTNNADDVTVVPAAVADLAVTKEWGTVNAQGAFAPIVTAAPGDAVSIRLTAANLGPSIAHNVVLRDAVPAGITVTNVTPAATCANAAGVVTCNAGTLNAGAVFEAIVNVTVTNAVAGQVVSNTATVDGTEDDPVGSNDSATAPLGVNQAADLELIKSAVPAAVSVGGDITYTLAVTNNGPSSATGVAITDPLPAGLTFVSGNGCALANGVVTCTLPGSVANGATVTRSYRDAATGRDAGGRAGHERGQRRRRSGGSRPG